MKMKINTKISFMSSLSLSHLALTAAATGLVTDPAPAPAVATRWEAPAHDGYVLTHMLNTHKDQWWWGWRQLNHSRPDATGRSDYFSRR